MELKANRGLRNCMIGVRAEPYECGAPKALTLELCLTGLKQRFGESRVDLMAYGRTQWS